MQKMLPDKGNAPYLPRHSVNDILDKYAPGWTWEITSTQVASDRIFIVGRLTIPTNEGSIYREATGTEKFTRVVFDKEKREYVEKDIAYGDPRKER